MSDLKLLARILKIKFHKALMGKEAQLAYEQLSVLVQSQQTQNGFDLSVTVPAHIAPKAAEKALKQLQLEYPDPIRVTWAADQAENGKPAPQNKNSGGAKP